MFQPDLAMTLEENGNFMKLCIIGLLLSLSFHSYSSCVILLHGLARTESSMANIEKSLLKQGYKVINNTYPSREFTINELAIKAIKPALLECQTEQSVNFVTHSLGGILVRQYLQDHTIENLKYTVMLGPPNQGSEVVDKLAQVPGFKFINGPSGLQLGTSAQSVPNTLEQTNMDVGIIAGTQSINWVLSSLIPGKDDGKVSIKRTYLDGMKDHISLPVTHTFMMKDPQVIQQIIHFLEYGQFTPGTTAQ